MKKAIFLDFDGVICDSILECLEVSFNAFYKSKKPIKGKKEIRNLFIEYRGLVGPAWQYYCLHDVINKYNDTFENEFLKSVSNIDDKVKYEFQDRFFNERKQLQKNNLLEWIRLNPLTEFGKSLIDNTKENLHIITTKDTKSVEIILKHNNIKFTDIYGKKMFEKHQSKGKIINDIFEKNNYDKAIFIDDHVKHLDSVDNKNVQCYFKLNGYGKNTTYKVFEEDIQKL